MFIDYPDKYLEPVLTEMITRKSITLLRLMEAKVEGEREFLVSCMYVVACMQNLFKALNKWTRFSKNFRNGHGFTDVPDTYVNIRILHLWFGSVVQ